MQESGIYIKWDYFRRGKTGGQVATLITLAIAVIFLFVAVTLNISRVSEKKTLTSNAADGAAMKVASLLASRANQLSLTYVGGGDYKRNEHHSAFVDLLTTAFMAFVFWPAAIPTTATYLYETTILPQRIKSRLNKLFSEMKLEDGLAESAILYALTMAVDDPTMVDDADDDDDDETTDRISHFSQWYLQRAEDLADAAQTESNLVEDFISRTEEFNDRLNKFESIQDWDKDFRHWVHEEDDTFEDGAFIVLLRDLTNEPGVAGFSFWRAGYEDEVWDGVNELERDLNVFKDFFTNYTVETFTLWMYITKTRYLYREEYSEEGWNWYDRWAAHTSAIELWERELNIAYNTLAGKITAKGDELARLEKDIAAKEEEIAILGDKVNAKKQEIDIVKAEILELEGLRNSTNKQEIRPQIIAKRELRNSLNAEKNELVNAGQIVIRDKLELQEAKNKADAEIVRLTVLQSRVPAGINILNDFQNALRQINQEIALFYYDFKYAAAGNNSAHRAVYSWHDSLGWHHVQLDVTPFKTAWIDTDVDRDILGYDEELFLKDYSGTVTVTVTRYDQDTAASFARRGTPLWKFRYVKDAQAEETVNPANARQALAHGISSEATAEYTYNQLPKLIKVK